MTTRANLHCNDEPNIRHGLRDVKFYLPRQLPAKPREVYFQNGLTREQQEIDQKCQCNTSIQETES